ncbi:PBP1A family penicillin-binding protein [Candidatus Roizmanbacteria bacterium]|nr:PBP1A family penicillin-binding protein [Candidatus Roizmanbacteria bacterium]
MSEKKHSLLFIGARLLQLIFFVIFLIINFVITIGEAVRFLIISILRLLWHITRSTYRIFYRVVLGFVNIFQFIFILYPKRILRIISKALPKKRQHSASVKVQFPRIALKPVKYIFSSKITYFLLGFFVCFILLLTYQIHIFMAKLPSPDDIGKVNYALSSHIYDRKDRLLYEVYKDQNRTPVHLSELPSYVSQAAIAVEDKDFYNHKGVSLFSGIFRALKATLVDHQLQGGSTITQQLVKSALLTPERTIERKIKEIVLAVETEQKYSKQQILEMYLNQVPYGGSAYGIEEAAKMYFGKSAKDLTLSEAAMLAGLPQAPTTYSPYTNPDLTKYRRNEVLQKMFEQGYVTEAQKTMAQNEDLTIKPLPFTLHAPHFVFYVKSELESIFGSSEVEQGGLKVKTTLDLDIQEEAEKILREELDKIKNLRVSNGGILVTKPSTGEILAMVGSVDYYSSPSGAFNVTTAYRQPGSSIKPLLYSLALEKGVTAATILDDSRVVYTGASGSYAPVNYDGQFHGKIPLRYALANSYNIPAVKMLDQLGISSFVSHATRMGISTWTDPSRFGLSLSLGGGEVTMIDMATAYGALANKGEKVKLTPVVQVTESDGTETNEVNTGETRVINSETAYIISDILSDNVARQWAFGPNSLLQIKDYKVAVKTGTTDSKKDNWTIGYTPDFLVVVWVGNNDGTPMNPALTSGITGAAPVWNRVMTYLLTKYADKKTLYKKPDGVVEKPCYSGRTELFIRGTENLVNCAQYRSITPTPTPKP